MYRTWLGWKPFIIINRAKEIETILSSPINIDKSSDYEFFKPWLNTGLLNSNGNKWRNRRKLLTPSFHFRILDNFVEVFNEQSEILLKQLKIKEKNIEGFDIYKLITLCSLDIICDSIMGRHVNAQEDKDSQYIQATERMKVIIYSRQITPWLWPDWIFKLSSLGREHDRCLKILHTFTQKVIAERKIIWKNKEITESSTHEDDDFIPGRKIRLAFLDCLLEASEDGRVLSDEDIREEVDTFMFEGHDTVATAISFALFLLGHNLHIQKKVHEELDSVFGDDKARRITTDDLKELKYLECVIKEALRLFPSVPMIGRQLKEDIVFNGLTVPAGVTVILLLCFLHRDPEIFPDPEKFDPDRFLPENQQRRHPFAYLPFSGGSRNCIGQKFAIMEEKFVLAQVLRSYCIESLASEEELNLVPDLVIRAENGIKVRIKPRV